MPVRPDTLAIRKGIGALRSATMNEWIHAAVEMMAEAASSERHPIGSPRLTREDQPGLPHHRACGSAHGGSDRTIRVSPPIVRCDPKAASLAPHASHPSPPDRPLAPSGSSWSPAARWSGPSPPVQPFPTPGCPGARCRVGGGAPCGAGLRPPLKPDVRFSRIRLSQGSASCEWQWKESVQQG